MSNKREKHFLALEFASGGVKAVQMKEAAEGFELLGTGIVPLPFREDCQTPEQFWKEAALQLISQEQLEGCRLLLSINDPHTCFSQFVLPKIPKKELAETLKWKMKDDIPYSAEEAVLDYRLFETVEGDGPKHYSTLVTALPHSVTDHFYRWLPTGRQELFQPAFVTFSISSLPGAFSLSSHELIVVVDIGHSLTEIAFYADAKLSFLRKIAFGGFTLSQLMTQPLMSDRGPAVLTLEEAERVKKTEDLLDVTSRELVGGKIEVSTLFALIRPELEKLAREIERSLEYYAQEHGSSKTQIFLTGGGSRLKGLAKFLEENIGTPVACVNLAKDIEIPEAFQSEDLSPYYRLISLVLDRKGVHWSRFSKPLHSVKRFVQSVSYARVGTAVFLIYLILMGGMLWRNFEIGQKTRDLRHQITNLESGFSEVQKIQAIKSQINRGEILSSAVLAAEPYWEEVFGELAHVFPDDVLLTDVSYEAHSFVLTGKILSEDREASIAKLLQAAEGPIFQKVILVNTEQREDFISFTIRARSPE